MPLSLTGLVSSTSSLSTRPRARPCWDADGRAAAAAVDLPSRTPLSRSPLSSSGASPPVWPLTDPSQRAAGGVRVSSSSTTTTSWSRGVVLGTRPVGDVLAPPSTESERGDAGTDRAGDDCPASGSDIWSSVVVLLLLAAAARWRWRVCAMSWSPSIPLSKGFCILRWRSEALSRQGVNKESCSSCVFFFFWFYFRCVLRARPGGGVRHSVCSSAGGNSEDETRDEQLLNRQNDGMKQINKRTRETSRGHK